MEFTVAPNSFRSEIQLSEILFPLIKISEYMFFETPKIK